MNYLGKNHIIYYGWIILSTVLVIRLVTSGLRISYGIFLPSLQEDLDLSRSSVAGAAGFALLFFAISQPLVGKLVDRFGPKKTIVFGTILIGLSHILMSTISNPLQLYLYYGFLAGIGFGAASSVPSAVLVTDWFRRRRAFAVSIAASGVGGGYPAIVPLSAFLILTIGWRSTYIILATLPLLIILPLALILIRRRSSLDNQTNIQQQQYTSIDNVKTPLKHMIRARSFWLLFSAYTVCGFTVSFVEVHLFALASDGGISPLIAASALGIMGIPMIAGLLVSGVAVDRFGRKNPLALAYAIRGLSMLLLLLTPTQTSIYLFVIVFGFVELMTIPPTTTLCREIFGAKSMGLVYGIIYGGHQLGGALSSYLGGVVFDVMGSYTPMIFLSILLLSFASITSLLVREPLREPHIVMASNRI